MKTSLERPQIKLKDKSSNPKYIGGTFFDFLG